MELVANGTHCCLSPPKRLPMGPFWLRSLYGQSSTKEVSAEERALLPSGNSQLLVFSVTPFKRGET